MLELRYVHAWRAASVVLLSLVLAATLAPSFYLDFAQVDVIGWLSGVDKWSHFLAFLLLSLWFAGLYRRQRYWLLALGLFAFGVLIELCQSVIAYRSAEWLDLAADVAGVAAGLSVAWIGAGGWCQRVEVWLATRAG